ncbi:MAG: hypothetical protein M0C28_26640 [Candidatus Moduliflexus flocculans]|nr:hypothetical protein [Candidatus Moduliflexus flocculans]
MAAVTARMIGKGHEDALGRLPREQHRGHRRRALRDRSHGLHGPDHARPRGVPRPGHLPPEAHRRSRPLFTERELGGGPADRLLGALRAEAGPGDPRPGASSCGSSSPAIPTARGPMPKRSSSSSRSRTSPPSTTASTGPPTPPSSSRAGSTRPLVRQKIESHFGAWAGPAPDRPRSPGPSANDGERVCFVESPDESDADDLRRERGHGLPTIRTSFPSSS